MSLPSYVVFKKDGEVVREVFTNYGWFCTPKTVQAAIRMSLRMNKENFEWDTALAYDMEFKKEEIL